MKKLLEKIKAKRQQRKERDEATVRDFIQTVAHIVQMQQEQQDGSSITYMPPPVPEESMQATSVARNTTRAKPACKWLISVVACVLCVIIALLLALSGFCDGGQSNGDDGNGKVCEKPYSAGYAKEFGQDDGIFFDDIYAVISADDGMLIFTQVMSGWRATKEVYNDESEELLSYVLYGLIANASAGADLVVFEIDYRVRFVPQYKFTDYEAKYGKLDNKFYICGTEVRWELKNEKSENEDRTKYGGETEYAKVYLNFAYGKYDYFLEIRTFEMENFGVVTELEGTSIIKLMQNLIPDDCRMSPFDCNCSKSTRL